MSNEEEKECEGWKKKKQQTDVSIHWCSCIGMCAHWTDAPNLSLYSSLCNIPSVENLRIYENFINGVFSFQTTFSICTFTSSIEIFESLSIHRKPNVKKYDQMGMKMQYLSAAQKNFYYYFLQISKFVQNEIKFRTVNSHYGQKLHLLKIFLQFVT